MMINGVSLSDETLAELIILKDAIRPIEIRIASIENAIRLRGTFVTSDHAAVVLDDTKVMMAPLSICAAVLGYDKLDELGLIMTSKYKTVKVSKRAHGMETKDL